MTSVNSLCVSFFPMNYSGPLRLVQLRMLSSRKKILHHKLLRIFRNWVSRITRLPRAPGSLTVCQLLDQLTGAPEGRMQMNRHQAASLLPVPSACLGPAWGALSPCSCDASAYAFGKSLIATPRTAPWRACRLIQHANTRDRARKCLKPRTQT